MRRAVFLSCVSVLLVAGTHADGAVIVDHAYSNAASTGSSHNYTNGGNFRVWDDFVLSSAAEVNAASFLFTEFNAASASFYFEIRNNQSGTPGSHVYSTSLTPSQVTTTYDYLNSMERFEFALTTPVQLAAGHYWINFSGTNLAGGNQFGGDGILQQFASTNTFTAVGNTTSVVPFELRGAFQAEAVPEPASLAIFGIGGAGLGCVYLRRKQRRSRFTPA